MYVASQYSHLYGRSPSCTDCMWTIKTRLLTYTLLQTSQTTGALEPSEFRTLGTLSWTVLMCRFRWVFWVNFHEHWSHSKGLSPVWLLWWLWRNKSNGVLNSLYCILGNRPFYSCVFSDLAFEWQWGWRWPCFDKDHAAFVVLMLTSWHLNEKKQRGLYQSKDTSGLACSHRPGNKAHCKMTY